MRRRVALMLPIALGVAACGTEPVAPVRTVAEQTVPSLAKATGTGVVLDNVTGVTVPLLNTDLGDVVIHQVVVKEFGLVEDALGNIVGLEARGVVELTGGVLGSDVVSEDFATSVGFLNSGSGQCEVATVDPAPLEVDVLGQTATVDVPVGSVSAHGSGAVGNLLCAAGRLLSPVTSGASRAVRSIVDAINRLLI